MASGYYGVIRTITQDADAFVFGWELKTNVNVIIGVDDSGNPIMGLYSSARSIRVPVPCDGTKAEFARIVQSKVIAQIQAVVDSCNNAVDMAATLTTMLVNKTYPAGMP